MFLSLRAPRVRIATLCALLGVLVGALSTLSPSTGAASAGTREAPPPSNVVLVLMDDFSMDLLPTMSEAARMRQRGAVFTQSFVADSLCCVSRAALLTGQYPHLNRVFTNTPNTSSNPLGGWQAFERYGGPAKSVNVALHGAGYTTGFMGKYINGYTLQEVDGVKVAPDRPEGWDYWQPILAGGYRQWGWRYLTERDGADTAVSTPVTYQDADYSTNAMADWATDFVTTHEAGERPYFLEVSTYGTHARVRGKAHQGDPLFPPAYQDRPGHARVDGNCGLLACPAMDARRLVGYDDDRADNTPVYLDGTLARPWQPNDLVVDPDVETARLRNRAQMAQSIDRLLGRILAAIGPNTYVVLTSDNGFHLGQHRLHLGKSTPYSSDTQVPLVVVGPGVVSGTRDQVVGNVDLAPTFETMAGLQPSTERAGSSFLPVLRDLAAAGNTHTYFEHTYSRTNPETDPDYDSDVGGSSVTLPSYLAVRTSGALLVRWDLDKSHAGTDHAYELYRYRCRRYERTNVYARFRSRPWVHHLRSRIERFAVCDPAECRDLAR